MSTGRETPWANATRAYAGWVPNVRSHLSFSVIGASRRALAYSRPYRAGTRRLAIAIERRTSNDLPLPTTLVRWWDRELTQDWLMEGLTHPAAKWRPGTQGEDAMDRQGMLLGTVHIIPWQTDRERHRDQKLAIGEIRDEITLAPAQPTDARLDALHEEVLSIVKAKVVDRIEIRFALMRSGELRLWYDDLALPRIDERFDGAEAPEDGRDPFKQLAEQAYFFIKDVVHDHTHHEPSSDQITPLTETTANTADPSHGGDVAWRRETVWSLSREIERLNRDGGLVDQRRSLGIIAYAQAFQESLLSHVRDAASDTGFKEAPALYEYDFTHLKASIKAKIDVSATSKTQFVQLALAFSATFLSALSVVGSLTSARNSSLARAADGRPIDGVVISYGISLLRFLAWNPFFTASAMAVLLLGIVAFTLADGKAGLFNRAQRVISQIARAASISLAEGSRKQVGLNWLMHVAAAFVAFLGCVGCLAIITGVFWA